MAEIATQACWRAICGPSPQRRPGWNLSFMVRARPQQEPYPKAPPESTKSVPDPGSSVIRLCRGDRMRPASECIQGPNEPFSVGQTSRRNVLRGAFMVGLGYVRLDRTVASIVGFYTYSFSENKWRVCYSHLHGSRTVDLWKGSPGDLLRADHVYSLFVQPLECNCRNCAATAREWSRRLQEPGPRNYRIAERPLCLLHNSS